MKWLERDVVWLEKEISRCEKEIDKGGPFYDLQSEKEAYEKILDRIKYKVMP